MRDRRLFRGRFFLPREKRGCVLARLVDRQLGSSDAIAWPWLGPHPFPLPVGRGGTEAGRVSWIVTRFSLVPSPFGREIARGMTSAALATSPGARITAIRFPTGISSPGDAVTFAKIPEPGASISTVALSVSISMSGSPLETDCPSALSHLSSVPVCCATPRAGMITLVAKSPSVQRFNSSRVNAFNASTFHSVQRARIVQIRLGLARRRQLAAGCEIMCSGDQNFSDGKRVITSQPSLVTTTSSSSRAADQPSEAGQ